MIDVGRQLEEYGAFHDQEWGPIDSEDMLAVFVTASSETTFVRWVKSNRVVFGVATAVATLLLIGLIPLLTNNSDTQLADTLAPPTIAPPTIAPPTIAPPTIAPPTTASVETVEEWLQIPDELQDNGPYLRSDGIVGRTEGGTYRTGPFAAGFSFTVPNDWEKVEFIRQSDTGFPGLVWIRPLRDAWALGGPPSDWYEVATFDAIWFIHDPFTPDGSIEMVDIFIKKLLDDNEVRVTEPVDVVIGGAPGKTIEVSAEGQSVTIEGLPGGTNEGQDEGQLLLLTVHPERPIVIHVLTVGTETIALYADAASSGEEFINEAQTIIDSIVWKALLN